MDISKVSSSGTLYNNNNLLRKNNNINSSSFSRLLESSISSIGSSSSCNCNGGGSGLSSLYLLTTIASIINESKVNNMNNSEVNSNENTNKNETNKVTSNKVESTSLNSAQNLTPSVEKAMDLLKAQVGKPYVWGANGPDSFDCSGLTRYIYKNAFGKEIPRVSYEQAEYGKSIAKKDLQPGDLVFFDTRGKGRVSHVGIYIGNDEFIHAANSKKGVIKSSLSGYYEKKYMGARRP